jgi:excisionase family DNA binding protein
VKHDKENKRMTSSPAVSETVPLLTPSEVAAAFRVDPKTVTRWAKTGKLSCIRTLGGHRRYLAQEVHAILFDVTGSFEVPAERPNPFLAWNGSRIHGQ